jgi:hypothetical protein
MQKETKSHCEVQVGMNFWRTMFSPLQWSNRRIMVFHPHSVTFAPVSWSGHLLSQCNFQANVLNLVKSFLILMSICYPIFFFSFCFILNCFLSLIETYLIATFMQNPKNSVTWSSLFHQPNSNCFSAFYSMTQT